MPKFICFFSYEPQTVSHLIESPSDRAAVARKVVESQGGRLESFYWMFGPYDGFLLAEYPDAKSAVAAAAGVAAAGRLRRFETFPLIEPEAIQGILKKAQGTLTIYKK